MNDSLLVEFRGPILVLTINRPEVRNAMNLATATQLAAALDLLEGRDDLVLAILTGAGGTFCSGMDLKGFLAGERPSIPGRGFGGLTQAPPRKVLIAAVEGHALAGGFELALACDLIVAARTARFGLPEVKRGLVASAGGLLRLPRRMPFHLAMEYALTGELMTAEVAHAHGLLNRMVEPGDALKEALALAETICANGPLSVQATKRIIVESADWSTGEMFTLQRPIAEQVFASADAREGASAFKEKRMPKWTGR